MRTLWVRMAEIYGHRWTSSYGDSESGAARTWAKGLAGVSPVQLAAGLADCIASADPWPPTLPEFRARCLGVPSLGAVRSDIATRSTAFVVKCWEFIDAHAYRAASRDAAARMVRDAYEQAREFVMRGGQLPAVVAALEGQGPADAKPERSWRTPSESALENELAFIRQQFAVGALGEGDEAVTERDALIAAARQRHATAATTPAEAEPA